MNPRMSTTGRDGGFTLVELVIAMGALGIILPAIAATFIVGLKTTDETNKRFLDSHDVESAAAFVNSDVQNASSISVSDTADCVALAFPAAAPGLYLSWSDTSNEGSSISHQVNYYVSGKSLVRSSCVGAAAASAIPLIQNLDYPATPPDVLCHSPSNCSSATTPLSVALRGKTATGQLFSLIGTRRTT